MPPKEPRARTHSLAFTLNRQKLRVVRRREGRYLLRTNFIEHDRPSCGSSTSNLPKLRRPSRN